MCHTSKRVRSGIKTRHNCIAKRLLALNTNQVSPVLQHIPYQYHIPFINTSANNVALLPHVGDVSEITGNAHLDGIVVCKNQTFQAHMLSLLKSDGYLLHQSQRLRSYQWMCSRIMTSYVWKGPQGQRATHERQHPDVPDEPNPELWPHLIS